MPAELPPRTGALARADRDLHDQMKAGSFQLSLVRDTISETYQQASKLPKSLGEGRDAILDTLDGLGQELGKFGDEPPPMEEFTKDLAGQRKRRADAITMAKDSIHELNEIRGEILAIGDVNTDDKLQARLDTLDALIEDAIETLLTAIKGFGEAPVPEAQL